MIKNKLAFIMILSLFIPTITYAECTKEEIDAFKEIEDKYKITYEFNKDTKLYTLTFYSPEPDLYNYVFENNISFSNCNIVDNYNIVCNNIKSGTYNFDIVSVNGNCYDTLKKKEIMLPKYNKYSENPLCEGIEDFVLCQPTYDKDIDYDTFVSRVNTYKKNLEEKPQKEEKQETVNEENKIIKYIKDNLFQIIIVTIFIVMVIITIILMANSIKKSRRLE